MGFDKVFVTNAKSTAKEMNAAIKQGLQRCSKPGLMIGWGIIIYINLLLLSNILGLYN